MEQTSKSPIAKPRRSRQAVQQQHKAASALPRPPHRGTPTTKRQGAEQPRIAIGTSPARAQGRAQHATTTPGGKTQRRHQRHRQRQKTRLQEKASLPQAGPSPGDGTPAPGHAWRPPTAAGRSHKFHVKQKPAKHLKTKHLRQMTKEENETRLEELYEMWEMLAE